MRPTVLVLGAGASAAFDMPLGVELKVSIAKALDIKFEYLSDSLKSGDRLIVEALKSIIRDGTHNGSTINDFRRAAIEISETMPFADSIDEYIERHSVDELKKVCAKLAITKCILESERGSNLAARNGTSKLSPEIGDSWLSKFLNHATRGKSFDEIGDAFENLLVINFNYDRCFEQFCFLWLKQFYHLDDSRAAEALSHITIFHPYGKVGSLPFQNEKNSVMFGEDLTAYEIKKIYPDIRTYSEAIDEVLDRDAISAALAETRQLIFLGFAFHPQNIDIISMSSPDRAAIKCYATTKGMSAPLVEQSKDDLRAALKLKAPNGLYFEAVPGTCEEFWNEFGQVLMR